MMPYRKVSGTKPTIRDCIVSTHGNRETDKKRKESNVTKQKKTNDIFRVDELRTGAFG
jgi:hypothetical protein